MIWTGGFNRFESVNQNNIWGIELNPPGFITTENGKNYFIVPNINYKHLSGFMNTYDDDYQSHGNCWYANENPTTPITHLINNDNETMTVQYQGPPYIDCTNWDDQLVDRIINNRGFGILDTTIITQLSTLPTPGTDEAIYASSVKNQKLKIYTTSISDLKNLINLYPNSNYVAVSIFKLYENYLSSDTNHSQNWRNIIFGDLKDYLESKILSNDTNAEFVNIAFEFFLKCAIKKINYQLALDGLEFIANNSSSTYERMMASINYIVVEGLIQGQSGSEKENSEHKMKPIKDILLKNYANTNKLIKDRENLELSKSKDKSKIKIEQDKKHQFDKKLENRAIENISISKSLTKEQRRERIRKDLMLLTQREFTKSSLEEPKQVTIKYSLSQNYPNPFNPVTKINYSIAKQGFVTLKIYDILGREIKTLVNEVKTPGNYIVEFNGSEFSSGVYFYKIQSDNFSRVKRMVLIK